MAKILSDLTSTIIAGIVLAVLLIIVLMGMHDATPTFDKSYWSFLFRWLHVLSGVMWIGILWYFNFVQIPNMGKIPDEQKQALGIVQVEAAEKAKAGRTAMLFSRTNTMLSIPMLYAMVAAQNLF
jgi:uncharacterized membrane protein